MRAVFVAVLIALVASSASQSLDLSAIGKSLLENFMQAGLKAVQGLVDQGKKIFSDSWQVLPDLLQGTLFGRREITSGFKDTLLSFGEKISQLADSAKEKGSAVFKAAVNRLQGMLAKFNINLGTSVDLDALNKEIDQVVTDHHTMQRRILGDIFQQGMSLFGGFVDSVKDVAGNLLTSAKASLSQLASAGLQKGAELLAKTGLLGRRAVLSLSDHLSNLGTTLAPLLDPFKDIISNLGATLKGHFSNIVDTVSGHVSTLKDKLSGHITDLAGHGSTLLEHGKNALSALGEVANDVLKQTLENAKPHIDAIAKTINDGANVVGDHLTGN